MSDKLNMQPVRGVRDIFGLEMELYTKIVKCAYEIAGLNNYSELMLPIFEFSEIFHRTLGESSDVVSKETYTFLDRDKTSITLRPEFTAGMVRSVISNGLTQSLPIKYFSHGPVFRHERPQKARYRQFYQLNFESIGVAEEYADIEIIALAYDLLTALGLKDVVSLELSSIGDLESRSNYKNLLVSYLSKYESELSEDSKVRLQKNPLRILDSKDESDRKILTSAPKIYDSFTKQAMDRFESVKDGLSNLGINFIINPKIVRGLDYYTHTVFEFTTNKLGASGSVIAGGRYDGLFEMMGGPRVPAIGFGSGIDRLCALLIGDFKSTINKLIFLVPIGDKALLKAPEIAAKLRNLKLRVDYVYHQNPSKQMQKANKLGATHTLIFGDEELSMDKFKLKNMETGAENIITLEQIINCV
ncbi:MAG: hisS [Candidatus Midichloriaceae bacterium]|jgi:histidyl-tRNA synthetase|nr:hisS [Candidatus Midichloriaceae bacterium]